MAKCLAFLDGYEYRVTSPYGERTHPVTGEKGKFHDGVDVVPITPASAEIKICPVASGIIQSVKKDVPGYSEVKGETGGNYVNVLHADDKITGYKHFKYGSIPDYVKPGVKVYKNTFIGIMGTTGLSTGIHLHFEVIKGGKTQYPEPHLNGTIKIPGWDEYGEVNDMIGYPILDPKKDYVNVTEHPADRVTKLQQILVHKYGFKLTINGLWSDELLNAIKQYQAENGLTVDGRVGPKTIESLNRDLYSEIKELRKAPAPDPALQAKVAQLEKDNSQLLADRTALQAEKAQLIKEKAEIAGNNAKLASDLDTANKKLATIRDAFNILKSV